MSKRKRMSLHGVVPVANIRHCWSVPYDYSNYWLIVNTTDNFWFMGRLVDYGRERPNEFGYENRVVLIECFKTGRRYAFDHQVCLRQVSRRNLVYLNSTVRDTPDMAYLGDIVDTFSQPRKQPWRTKVRSWFQKVLGVYDQVRFKQRVECVHQAREFWSDNIRGRMSYKHFRTDKVRVSDILQDLQYRDKRF